MRAHKIALVGGIAAAALGATIFVTPGQASTPLEVKQAGMLSDGTPYEIEKPVTFNGTVLIYSHGHLAPGEEDPGHVAPDPTTAEALLERGYALAATAFGSGYAVEEALRDQVELVDTYRRVAGKPKRVIAWGNSMGGLITAELVERRPDVFDGGVASCGIMAGTPGLLNTYLDTMFVIKTLLAPDLRITADVDPEETLTTLIAVLKEAEATPVGRARISLAAAMMDMPAWFGAGTPRPPADDLKAQVAAQVSHLTELDGFLMTIGRAEFERRAGGNPSSNVGVEYRRQLERSTGRQLVNRLYAAAGKSLSADLAHLAVATRVHSDPKAVKYASKFATFSGDLHGRPVVTLHNTGDGALPPEHEEAYRSRVRQAGDRQLLRQLFVERAGHCTFTPAELVATVQYLDHRVRTGKYAPSNPGALKATATALGPKLNGVTDDDTGDFIEVPPAFDSYQPGRFPRD